MELTPAETRVLGCLMEKERTTPENYPLSLNSLVAACNQLTNREPIMTLGDRAVEEALDALRQKKLATVIFGAGSRVQKYRHILPDIYHFTPQESALLCVLLLRGPQTAGELRQRAERMAPLATLAEAENVLESMAGGNDPFVRLLAARPGQKERRYVQLLSGEPAEFFDDEPARATVAGAATIPALDRLEAMAKEMAVLRGEIAELRANFDDFRRQLGG